tara:strand:- start:4063 stop:4365 length:303 start_codon:yes stop_codon:yes gene_type:complete
VVEERVKKKKNQRTVLSESLLFNVSLPQYAISFVCVSSTNQTDEEKTEFRWQKQLFKRLMEKRACLFFNTLRTKTLSSFSLREKFQLHLNFQPISLKDKD